MKTQTFSEYLKSKNMSAHQFAKLHGLKVTSTWMAATNRKVGPKVANLIYLATNRKVSLLAMIFPESP